MKRQWKIKRQMREYADGWKRWDQVYHLLLEIACLREEKANRGEGEESHASSDLCPSIDAATDTSTNH